MSISIDKRVPYAFKGVWGKCYKLTTFDETAQTVTYQNQTYYDIGSDVQVKMLEDGVDKSINNIKPVENLVTKGEFRYFKTTDAHLTDDGQFECVIQPNDIVFALGYYWVCEKIDERSVFNPGKQTFYYMAFKKIKDEIITLGV